MTLNALRKFYVLDEVKVDPSVLRSALNEWEAVHDDKLYDISTARERMSPALAHTRSYYLRIPNVPQSSIKTTNSTQNVLDCVDTELFNRFPAMRELIAEIGCSLFGGWTRMGRVFITKLQADCKIGRHVDEGEYFDKLHRFHVVLKSQGSTFYWDNHQAELLQGRIYKMNNSIPHWVENSGMDRTHLIFDAS